MLWCTANNGHRFFKGSLEHVAPRLGTENASARKRYEAAFRAKVKDSAVKSQAWTIDPVHTIIIIIINTLQLCIAEGLSPTGGSAIIT